MPNTMKIEDHEIFKHTSLTACANSSIKHPKAVVRNGDEVFFATNSTIRVSKIGSSSNYKLLDLQSKIGFEIQGLKLNSSQNLLAIYNEHNIIIVSLPASFSITNRDQTLIPTKSFVIASELYSNTEVLEVLWNKASRYDSCLVVLSSDGVVRSFDPRFSVVEPEVAHDLTSKRLRNVGFNADASENPVSIAFGAIDSLAAALTLYVLDRDGDVFALYPFLPRELSASKDQIEELLNTTVVLVKEVESNGKILEKFYVVNQLKFVMALWNQVSTSEREIRGDKTNHVLKCENIISTSLQGPFSINPYPEPLYEKTTTSLTTIDLEYSDALAIGFEQGGYLLLIPETELIMKWDGDFNEETDDKYPGFSTIEYGNSKSTGKSVVQAFNDHSFILQSGTLVIKADLSKLHKLYQREFDSTAVESDSDDESVNPELIPLYNLQVDETVEFVITTKDDYGSDTTLIVTSKAAKSLKFDSDKIKESKHEEESEQPIIKTYQLQLGAPTIEITNLLKKISSLNIKVPAEGKTKLAPTETLLRELNDISTKVATYLLDFHKAGIQINYKLDKQKTEYERQIEETNQLISKLEKLELTKSENSKTIKSYLERQKKLEEKSQMLNEQLQKAADTPLSAQERKWFKEIADTTRNFNKYAQQTEQWRKQLQYMKNVLEEKKKKKKAGVGSKAVGNEFELLNSQILEGKKYLK